MAWWRSSGTDWKKKFWGLSLSPLSPGRLHLLLPLRLLPLIQRNLKGNTQRPEMSGLFSGLVLPGQGGRAESRKGPPSICFQACSGHLPELLWPGLEEAASDEPCGNHSLAWQGPKASTGLAPLCDKCCFELLFKLLSISSVSWEKHAVGPIKVTSLLSESLSKGSKTEGCQALVALQH